ncbi:hypothetical protein Poly59_24980 [Rubripirellula reticaptiva]|uniref:Uncharacterized protein n=1 Tax=Rubripirellula reticaptiva TaxID=2528013 RepID=A0A5C6F6U3_9BACT|nr:hypothetical protein Poly59_24980 [Rubripirellula reticaptiva]
MPRNGVHRFSKSHFNGCVLTFPVSPFRGIDFLATHCDLSRHARSQELRTGNEFRACRFRLDLAASCVSADQHDDLHVDVASRIADRSSRHRKELQVTQIARNRLGRI